MAELQFLTPAWLEAYERVVRDAAATEDLSGVAFSMCEVFKNAPAQVTRGGATDAHIGFRLSGGRLEFPDRAWDDADFVLVADYDAIAPWLTLSAEQTRAAGIMERLHAAGKLRFRGSLAEAPKFVLTLHDRLAAITAPHVAAPAWEA